MPTAYLYCSVDGDEPLFGRSALHPLDATVVGVYLIAMLAVGFFLTRGVVSSKDFFLAGRRIPFWAIGMSLVVSDIGALEMVGGTANAFQYGVAQANYQWYGCIGSCGDVWLNQLIVL